MSPILVAIDGSKHSEKVVDAACEVAKQLSSSIILVHILRGMPDEPEGVKAFEETEHYREAYTDYLEEVGRAVTAKFGDRIQSKGVSYTAITEVGNPVERILETAKLEKSTLIVLGLHGHHYVGRIRSLGSVSRAVIENATCPVLVVP
jgi:nucleotide-binding universal stress UspA family protein